MYSNIVVGTDGSATAKQALRHAIDLAAINGGTVHIVSAYRSGGAGRQGRHRGRALVRRQPHQDRCRSSTAPRRWHRSKRTDRRDPRRRERIPAMRSWTSPRGRRRRRRRRQQGDAQGQALPARQRPEQGRPQRPLHRGHRQDDVRRRSPPPGNLPVGNIVRWSTSSRRSRRGAARRSPTSPSPTTTAPPSCSGRTLGCSRAGLAWTRTRRRACTSATSPPRSWPPTRPTWR